MHIWCCKTVSFQIIEICEFVHNSYVSSADRVFKQVCASSADLQTNVFHWARNEKKCLNVFLKCKKVLVIHLFCSNLHPFACLK